LCGRHAPKFLDWHYKIELAINYVVKFCGDRSTELGNLVLKKIMIMSSKTKAFANYPGSLIRTPVHCQLKHYMPASVGPVQVHKIQIKYAIISPTNKKSHNFFT